MMKKQIDGKETLQMKEFKQGRWSRREFIRDSLIGAGVLAGTASMPGAVLSGAPVLPLPHHTDEYLQRVLNWTPEERQAAADAARSLQEELNLAIKAGQSRFRIPPGDYLEWIPPGRHAGHRAVFVVQGAENMEIDATGATFWNSGLRSEAAVVFADCRNCRVKGLTADLIHSPFVQGVVSEIIPDGAGPGRDRLLLDLEQKGFVPLERLAKDKGSGRTWRLRKDGQVEGYLAVNPDKKLSASGKWEWTCGRGHRRNSGIEPGDRLSVGVNGSGGIVVIRCGGMTFDDLTVFSCGSFCVWEQGVRCPGGNTYRRMRIIPRPGSIRIGVGSKDGFHSYNQHKGPTLIDCEIARTHDDGINIHGFINVVVKKLPDNRYVLASICGRDFDIGSELLLHRAPMMNPLGTAKVTSWEPFDSEDGRHLFAAMQKRSSEEYQTSVRELIMPEFSVVTIDEPIDLEVLDMAASHDYCGKASRIDKLYMHDGCNRGIFSPGTASVVENSRFKNIPFGGIGLSTGANRYLEGGWMQDVKILNNELENCGELVFGGWFRNGVLWQILGAISASPVLPPHFEPAFLHLTAGRVYKNIEIRGNRIRNTQGLPIFLGNTIGAVISDNIIEKPFQASPEKLRDLDLTREGVIKTEYTPPVPDELLPVLKEPFYGIFISACEDVTVRRNSVYGSPAHFKGLVGIGPWSRNIHVT